MLRVYDCLTLDHDWRLVALAFAVCVLASSVAISLFHRVQATTGDLLPLNAPAFG